MNEMDADVGIPAAAAAPVSTDDRSSSDGVGNRRDCDLDWDHSTNDSSPAAPLPGEEEGSTMLLLPSLSGSPTGASSWPRDGPNRPDTATSSKGVKIQVTKGGENGRQSCEGCEDSASKIESDDSPDCQKLDVAAAALPNTAAGRASEDCPWKAPQCSQTLEEGGSPVRGNATADLATPQSVKDRCVKTPSQRHRYSRSDEGCTRTSQCSLEGSHVDRLSRSSHSPASSPAPLHDEKNIREVSPQCTRPSSRQEITSQLQGATNRMGESVAMAAVAQNPTNAPSPPSSAPPSPMFVSAHLASARPLSPPRYHSPYASSPAARGVGNKLDVHYGSSGANLSPGEVEELSELRSLLPMFRALQVERRRVGCHSSPSSPSPSDADAAAIAADGKLRPYHRGSSTMSRGTITPSVATARCLQRVSALGGGIDHSFDSSDDAYSMGGEYVKLSRDVYSLLYYSIPCSMAFFMAIFIFVFQMLILSLIMVDIIDIGSSNPLDIPAGVSGVVRASQFLAVLVAVATQEDLITSINAVHIGYQKSVLADNGRAGGARWQWLIAVSSRFCQGALCLAVTFILIMRSDDVVGLFLDFLAVTFVSTIDDITFALARDGYFSRTLRDETAAVMRVRVPKPKQPWHFFRPLVFLTVSGLMLMGWGIIVSWQNSGEYLSCNRVAIQFGDEFRATLGFFSSIYEVSYFSGQRERGRPIYIERHPALGPGHEGKAMFGYCEELKAWTFSFADEKGGEVDICNNWYARSVETDAHDIMAISSAEWFVYGTESKGAVPFQHFSLRCIDCNQDASERGSCSTVGTCIDNQCICNEGRYGLNCEFQEPCPSIEVDTSTARFPGPHEWSSKYNILHLSDGRTKAKVYERPVYTRFYDDDDAHDVIMFTGRRWVVTNTRSFVDINTSMTTGELGEFLTYSFHAHWTEYDAEFISSPTDVVSPTDAATPVGLQWYRTTSYSRGVDTNLEIRTLLLCAECNNSTNPCNHGGTCADDKRCRCEYGTFGTLCQIKDFVLCERIAVQFGASVVSSLDAFSGVYELDNSQTINGRSVYVERRSRSAMFAYCEEEKSWTFTHLVRGARREKLGLDPCADWRARSLVTESYDITTIETAIVRRNMDADEGVPLQHFSLTCLDCDRIRKKRPCNNGGQCVDNQCVCNSGRYGLNCQLYEPCPKLEADVSRLVKTSWPTRYELLRHENGTDVEVYERPVYVYQDSNHSFYVILYTGRRWAATESGTHAFLGNKTTRGELVAYLTGEFHGYYSDYVVDSITEPADVDTALDLASPVDLTWFETEAYDDKRADLQEPRLSYLYCALCNNLNHPCQNAGRCIKETCSCQSGTFGTLCQVDDLCLSLSVNFDEEMVGAEIAAFAGVYDVKASSNNAKGGGRPVYLAQRGNAMFAYCESQRYWTFTSWNLGSFVGGQDPCNWIARSSATYNFDINTTTRWFMKNGTNPKAVALLSGAVNFSCNDDDE